MKHSCQLPAHLHECECDVSNSARKRTSNRVANQSIRDDLLALVAHTLNNIASTQKALKDVEVVSEHRESKDKAAQQNLIYRHT